MRYSTQIKPISYVKAHAASLLTELQESASRSSLRRMVKRGLC